VRPLAAPTYAWVSISGLKYERGAHYLSARRLGACSTDQAARAAVESRGSARRALALPACRRLPLRRGQDLHAGRSKETDLRAVCEHVPPDVTAAIFWMKSRDPAEWRDAWQLEPPSAST
jgi:hypothetical protein